MNPTTQQEGEDAEREQVAKRLMDFTKCDDVGYYAPDFDTVVDFVLADRKALLQRIKAEAPHRKIQDGTEPKSTAIYCQGFNEADNEWRAAIRKASGNE